MKTVSVQLCLAMIIIVTGSVSAVTVDVYSGHTQTGGGTPYTGLVGSFYSPDIMFWTNSDNYWFPFDLPDFGAEITGYLLVSATDDYEFELTTDDGSIVYIDDQVFMDYGGDGLKTAVTASITLTEGIHPFRIEFFEDWGSTSGVDFVLPDGVRYGDVFLEKTDGVPHGECRSPQDEIEYQICFSNDSEQELEDPFIIDWLPRGVDYDNILSLDPLVVDANYNEEEHYYRWDLDQIGPNTSCRNLTVTVRDIAPPGGYLHNVAQLWATVHDTNGNPELKLIKTATADILVCCYMPTPEVLYVDKNAVNGADSGLDWQNAFTSLHVAMEYARSAVCGEVDTIYVAQGIYSPGDDENDTFELAPNLSLLGGFKQGGCSLEQRNPKRYETTLSGKIDDTHRNDRIVTMGDGTLLNGFTVSEASRDGAGVFASGVDFTVENCTIEHNGDYGAYIENGNATFRWTTVRNNDSDGIRLLGSGYELVVENCWIRQNMRNGIYCQDSTPMVINSVVTESDLAREGRAGIQMINPASQPFLQNNTIAHNKAEGIWLTGSTLPDIKNCIVYHNNSGGPQLAGFSADQSASYSCIQDCNEVNSNINDDPEFAYFDPNNVRIMADSLCHDSGLTLQENYSQFDMDNRTRVLGNDVDRGAYEIECDQTGNTFDWNADGMVNMAEFNIFSKAWLKHNPNDPAIINPNHPDHQYLTDPNSPGYIDPNCFTEWDSTASHYNFADTGASQYAIDTADLMVFLDHWQWMACWLYNPYDFDKDGIVNYHEFQYFANAWLSYQGSPSWNPQCDLYKDNDNQINLTDLMEFLDKAPWMFVSDWVNIPSQTQPVSVPSASQEQTPPPQTEPNLPPPPQENNEPNTIEEPSIEQQIADLQDAIAFFENLWETDENIQQEISAEDWQAFMDGLYAQLAELESQLPSGDPNDLFDLNDPNSPFYGMSMMMSQSGFGARGMLNQSQNANQQEITDLQDSIQFLESLSADPQFQQEINADDWQQFMESVRNNLSELQTQSIQIE